MNEQQYRQFLIDLARKVSALVAENQPCAMSCFRDNCERFCKKKTAYDESFNKAVRAAEKDPKLRDYNDGVPPKKGWEWTWHDWKLGDVKFKGFWSKPPLFSPEDWTLEFYGPSVLNILFNKAKAKEPTNIQDKIMCDYVVLGLIHDECAKVAKIERLCSINDEMFRDDTWKELKLSGDILFKLPERGEEIKLRLEKALDRVKEDLDKIYKKEQKQDEVEKPAETERKKKGSIRKILKWLVGIIGTIIVGIIVTVITDILGDFGWIERIKSIVHNILTHK